MGRISIDVSDKEPKRLKALAALRGKSNTEFVLGRTLSLAETDDVAPRELETLLDGRIRAAKAGAVSRRTATKVFAEVLRKKSG